MILTLTMALLIAQPGSLESLTEATVGPNLLPGGGLENGLDDWLPS
ncbi:MAG: hypothetical protein GF320_07900, partial [Armatimonadia bacterium]|nr:hypothetical protein [Armatimonadia bacterium]